MKLRKNIGKIAVFALVLVILATLTACVENANPAVPPAVVPPVVSANEKISTKTEVFQPNATYYVATNGADTEATDGSIDKPFLTVGYAVKTLYAVSHSGGFQIIVRDGTYTSLFSYVNNYDNGFWFDNFILIKAENEHKAKVLGENKAVWVRYSKNIIFSGFEITGNPTKTSQEYVVHIEVAENIVLENNVIHDSYNNDLIKINERANGIELRNNVIYNPGNYNHIDVNSVYHITMEGNIFFVKADGANAAKTTAQWIVVKSSYSGPYSSTKIEEYYAADGKDPQGGSWTNGEWWVPKNGWTENISAATLNPDNRKPETLNLPYEAPTHDVTIRKNVFMNWLGASDQSFIVLGEDQKAFAETTNTTVSDNLFINNRTLDIATGDGNFVKRMSGVMTIKSAKNTVVDGNTVTGFIQHSWHSVNSTNDGFFGYLMRVSREGFTPVVDGVKINNNVLCDYSGNIGYISSGVKTEYLSSSGDGSYHKVDIVNYSMSGNTFYNGGKSMLNAPQRDIALMPGIDATASYGDPYLESNLDNVRNELPYMTSGAFALYKGFSTEQIRITFANKYGTSKISAGDLYARVGYFVENIWSKDGTGLMSAMSLTNKDIIVIISPNKNIVTPDGWEKKTNPAINADNGNVYYQKIYTDNTTEKITITDGDGGNYDVDISISNLDKIDPVVYVTYTKGENGITAVITFNEICYFKSFNTPEGWHSGAVANTYYKTYELQTKEAVSLQDLAGNVVDVEINTTTSLDPTSPWRITALVFISITAAGVLALGIYIFLVLYKKKRGIGFFQTLKKKIRRVD
jgi:hypothetical protein